MLSKFSQNAVKMQPKFSQFLNASFLVLFSIRFQFKFFQFYFFSMRRKNLIEVWMSFAVIFASIAFIVLSNKVALSVALGHTKRKKSRESKVFYGKEECHTTLPFLIGTSLQYLSKLNKPAFNCSKFDASDNKRRQLFSINQFF